MTALPRMKRTEILRIKAWVHRGHMDALVYRRTALSENPPSSPTTNSVTLLYRRVLLLYQNIKAFLTLLIPFIVRLT